MASVHSILNGSYRLDGFFDEMFAGAGGNEAGATTVRMTADEALAGGLGVCQDFAHLMIAACRIRRLPARYVSGYMATGRDYADVPPTRGVYKGARREQMAVDVRVEKA